MAKIRVAIEGCCHGQLDDIYDSIRKLEQADGKKVDLLLICGDFQSIRNTADMDCIASPAKYHQIGTFYKYYSGEKRAPYPTIFVGGNHEASNYLWELYHGGWVCENIYFLGFAGVVQFGGLRIGGLSGIYKERHFTLGHFETSPYSDGQMRSIYHIRNYEIFKLINLTGQLDIFLSHDWPTGIAHYGNIGKLLARKPFFRDEINRNTLGSPPSETLLHSLQPQFWFAAHMHVKFAAVVNHQKTASSLVPQAKEISNPDEIAIDMDDVENKGEEYPKDIKNPDMIEIEDDFDDEVSSAAISPAQMPQEKATRPKTVSSQANFPHPNQPATSITRFLALDKCLPNRDYLQLIDIPVNSNLPLKITYDEEWLAITKAAHPYLSLTSFQTKLPTPEDFRRDVANKLVDIRSRLAKNEIILDLPPFSPTAPVHIPRSPLSGQAKQDAKRPYLNPQTTYLCDLLGIHNKINPNGQTLEHLPKRNLTKQSISLQDDYILFKPDPKNRG